MVDTWWSSLQLIEKIYWIIAIPSTLLLVLQLIMTFLHGLDVDTDMDAHSDFDMDTGFRVLTFKNSLGFFTIFSWTGLGFISAGLGIFFSLFFSAVSGLLMMFLMAFIFYKISQLNESGTMDMNNAVDKRGQVYLTIPGMRSGMGKVNVTIQGSLRELDAMTDDQDPIPTGAIILVTELVNEEVVLVTKIN